MNALYLGIAALCGAFFVYVAMRIKAGRRADVETEQDPPLKPLAEQPRSTPLPGSLCPCGSFKLHGDCCMRDRTFGRMTDEERNWREHGANPSVIGLKHASSSEVPSRLARPMRVQSGAPLHGRSGLAAEVRRAGNYSTPHSSAHLHSLDLDQDQAIGVDLFMFGLAEDQGIDLANGCRPVDGYADQAMPEPEPFVSDALEAAIMSQQNQDLGLDDSEPVRFESSSYEPDPEPTYSSDSDSSGDSDSGSGDDE